MKFLSLTAISIAETAGHQNKLVLVVLLPLSVSFIPLIIPKSEIVIQGISGSGIDDIKSQISFGLNENFIIYYHFCPGCALCKYCISEIKRPMLSVCTPLRPPI